MIPPAESSTAARHPRPHSHPRTSARPCRGRGGRLARTGVALVLALPAALLVPGVPSAHATATSTAASLAARTGDGDLTVVQANLLSPQTYQRFQRDARTVYRQSPDIVTFNEVAFRYDQYLAPEGYALWRTPGQYTGPTPVAWRTAAWSAVDQGTQRISNYQERPPGRSTKLGLRYANWVTLRSTSGDRTLSVISAHVPPPVKGMPDLRRATVTRIAALAEKLGRSGPVIVGGDFNLGYNGRDYPRDVLDGAGLEPTYDLLGTSFPTGDHFGLTIDYLFLRGDQLSAVDHHPVELRSDHDAVVAHFDWTTGEATSTREVRNDPAGDQAARRAVVDELVGAVDGAVGGETVRVATQGVALQAAQRSFVSAIRRGVTLQLTTRSRDLTKHEQRLADLTAGTSGSWVRQCVDGCAEGWRAGHPGTVVLVSDADNVGRVSVTSNRRVRRSMVVRAARAVVETGPVDLEDLRVDFADLRRSLRG